MRELPPSDLKACFGRPTWIDIEISNEQELEEIADKLGLSRRVILASSYPHVDKRSSYTKIFAWYPVISLSGKESSYRRLPVILLLNEVSTITVSSSATGLKKRIVEEMGRKTYADFSVSARATIIAMTYLLESHEQHVNRLERFAERYEEQYPPWTQELLGDVFNLWKGSTRLLRLLHRFHGLADSVLEGSTRLPFNEEEMEVLETVQDRIVGIEDTLEVTQETFGKMIDMHLETISHETNAAMRLMAAITCIVAIPNVVGAVLGMNLIDIPSGWHFWQVAAISASVAIVLAIYFYLKGWIGGPDKLFTTSQRKKTRRNVVDGTSAA